jgi:hypothetical protein
MPCLHELASEAVTVPKKEARKLADINGNKNAAPRLKKAKAAKIVCQPLE